MRRLVLPLLVAVAALGLGAPAASAAKRQAPAPVITKVAPLRATVGDTLRIYGRHFRPGKGRNGVGFKTADARIVFVRSDLSTRRMIKVKLPARLEPALAGATKRFQLRILTSRFARRYSPRGRSPLIAPRPAAPTPPGAPAPAPAAPAADAPVPTVPDGDCDGDGIPNRADDDDDNDSLSDALEQRIGTDGCRADSDGDGVVDGYEYRSAIDLNDDDYQRPQTALPYPGTRPYPNPLDDADADVDHDGDGLTLAEEQRLWRIAGTAGLGDPSVRLSYSAGRQYSLDIPAADYGPSKRFLAWADVSGYGTVQLYDARDSWPAGSVGWHAYALRDVDRSGTVEPSERSTLDRVNDDPRGIGRLSDDERDEDADGLSNIDELHGRMSTGYWTACYSAEPAYPVPYAGTDVDNPDSDGDGILDGADDQDFDDVPNLMEVSRIAASHFDDRKGLCQPADGLVADTPNHAGAYGFVHPFDPCKPDPHSRTCNRYVQIGTSPVPNWWALQ